MKETASFEKGQSFMHENFILLKFVLLKMFLTHLELVKKNEKNTIFFLHKMEYNLSMDLTKYV